MLQQVSGEGAADLPGSTDDEGVARHRIPRLTETKLPWWELLESAFMLQNSPGCYQ
jgi:hypothetical protein